MTPKDYFGLSDEERTYFRESFSEIQGKSKWAEKSFLDEIINTARQLSTACPQGRIYCLGRAPLWITETAKLMDTSAERYGYIAFSDSWWHVDAKGNPNLSKDSFPSHGANIAYRSYLEKIGMSPRAIINRQEKTVIVEYLFSGNGIISFLHFLFIWAKESNVPWEQLKDKISFLLLYSLPDRPEYFNKLSQTAPFLNTINFQYQKTDSELIEFLQDDIIENIYSLGILHRPSQWAEIDPLQAKPNIMTRIALFKIIDYLAQQGLLNQKASENNQNTSSSVKKFRVENTSPKIPLEERVANIRQRLAAPMERGSGWIRITAVPEEAIEFHKSWISQTQGNYKINFGENTYIFPISIIEKMAAWSEKTPDLERKGYFISRQLDNNNYQITDFIPFSTMAVDPDMSTAGTDPSTTQGSTTSFEVFGIEKDVALELGFNLDLQKDLAFSTVTGGDTNLIAIPFHSHHRQAAYQNSPSLPDQTIARKTDLVYCMGTKKLFLYNNTSFKEINISSAMKNQEAYEDFNPTSTTIFHNLL